MLPHSKRLTTELFAEIIEKGQSTHCSFSSIKLLEHDSSSRYAVSVPKKVAHTAVLRNKLRRRTYSLIRSLSPSLKEGFLVIVIIKQGAEKLSLTDFYGEIHKNFVKADLLK